MFFKKKTVSSSEFGWKFLFPLLEELHKECTIEILTALEKSSIKSNKDKKEIELEIDIWLLHISGKIFSQVKIFIDPFTPELINYTKETMEWLYDKQGENVDHDKFINETRTKYMDRVKAYETYEMPYAKQEITTMDFEATNAVIMLGVEYDDLPDSFVKNIEELHKGCTALIFEYLKKFNKDFKIKDKQ